MSAAGVACSSMTIRLGLAEINDLMANALDSNTKVTSMGLAINHALDDLEITKIAIY
jgi:hypothetical protein